jgi:hypothetical protein
MTEKNDANRSQDSIVLDRYWKAASLNTILQNYL